MTVIQKHGNSKPSEGDLVKFQFGYDNRENVYGKHEGKTLFIKDGNGEIKAITESLLKEEFVNYCFPCDENGEIDEANGTTVYAESNEPINGILENLNSHKDNVVDDAGVKMGEKISFGSYVVNPKTRQFTKPSKNAISIFSVDPTYLQKLKNNLEQKAVIQANTYQDMLDKAADMASAEKKTLESGVQFIVTSDENHDGKTWIYAVTDYDGEVGIENSLVGDDEIVIIDDDLVPSKDINIITSYNGNGYTLTPIAQLEYTYKPVVSMDTDTGLGVEVLDIEKDGTTGIKLNELTENTILDSYEYAYAERDVKFGIPVDEITYDDVDFNDLRLDKNLHTIKTEAKANGQSFVNVLKLKQKMYSSDGNIGLQTRSIIDFNDFVLDEGSWDQVEPPQDALWDTTAPH